MNMIHIINSTAFWKLKSHDKSFLIHYKESDTKKHQHHLLSRVFVRKRQTSLETNTIDRSTADTLQSTCGIWQRQHFQVQHVMAILLE